MSFSIAIALAALPLAAAERVDINTADQPTLEGLPGVGPVRAKFIVAMRERNGGFRCVEELRAVPRLTDKQFEKIRDLVKVTGSLARTDCAALEEQRRSSRTPGIMNPERK